MSHYWSKLVTEITPYVPGEQPRLEKLIKLNTNESPYNPSPRVIQILMRMASPRGFEPLLPP